MNEKDGSFDWQESLKLSNCNNALAEEILAMFAADLPTFKADILRAYQLNDLEKLSGFIHKLHGGCCYCGVPRLKQILIDMQNAINNHQFTQLSQLMNTFDLEIDQVLNSIQNRDFNRCE